MKPILFLVLTAALGSAMAANRPLGKLPNGTRYIADEVDFCLKADVARNLSPAGPQRRRVDPAGLLALHPAIVAVIGGHLTAVKWLAGEPLPAGIAQTAPEVPVIARSLKALLAKGQDAAVVVAQLRQHPDVQWASLNKLHPINETPNDTLWYSQWGPQRIRADEAWDVPAAATSVRVAIIDTGVDLNHPDLASRIVYNKGFGGNPSGDCMRDGRGGSSIHHGTHVAGIAAAIRDNNRGIAGIATAKIMALGCATWSDDDGEYFICCAADALNDAVANGATAINCSFGNDTLESSESSALDTAQTSGTVVVCASGNDGMNIANSPSAGWAQHSWPLLVGNVQKDDTINPSSNYGNALTLAAPGTGIYSTITPNNAVPPGEDNYGSMTGTSMASPHVAGSVALVVSINPFRLRGLGSRDLLVRMAQDLGAPGWDSHFGYGMVQLDPAFLGVLRSATTFVGNNPISFILQDGSYEYPYVTLADALKSTPAGGTLVLNGGTGGLVVNYAHQTISSNVTLTAFPDRPVTIGY